MGVRVVFIISMFYSNPILNANSVDAIRTPRSAASDLGPLCLSMSHLSVARQNWLTATKFDTVR